jgi:signal transduction histidine kinase
VRWSIGNQILVPFAGTLAIAVATIAVASAWLAARSQEIETLARLQRVVETLGGASFPYTEHVLEQMRGLSGAEFVALEDGNEIRATTLGSVGDLNLRSLPLVRETESFTQYRTVELAGVRYLAARVRSTGATSLLVLYPERRRIAARREAAWPPLAIGAATGCVMVGVSAWLSRRLSRRIDAVRALFARIAQGEFEHAHAGRPHDELHELIVSANRLSDQLGGMQRTIRQTERVRLLAQLAGGLAHQLRNSLTGARMAVQLHQRRCGSRTRRDDLAVAVRQLELTEEQVKNLLALGRDQERNDAEGSVADLIRDVAELVAPACRHAHVEFDWSTEGSAATVASYGRLRAALLNLALNAIEAAGRQGSVRIRSLRVDQRLRIEVSDNGPGPLPELRDSLFEPFVTSKPEGVGLGLAVARRTAEDLGGTLTWRCCGEWTVFTLDLPSCDGATNDVLRDEPSGDSDEHAEMSVAQTRGVFRGEGVDHGASSGRR